MFNDYDVVSLVAQAVEVIQNEYLLIDKNNEHIWNTY